MKYLLSFFLLQQVLSQKIYGDSLLASGTIQKDIENWSGVKIENFAVVGAGLLDGWVTSIPKQYENNKCPVAKTVIIDGGGNDIITARYDCYTFNRKCQLTLDQLVQTVSDLLGKMRQDGVKNIIYVGYYNLPWLERVIEVGTERMKGVCLESESCYFIDLRQLGIERSWDGLHPNEKSYHKISTEVWRVIQEHNLFS